ncbi:hypothetical protein BTM381_10780 [Helicobacter pylori]
MKKSFKKLGFVSLATSSVLLGSMNATNLETYAALQKPSHVFGNYVAKKDGNKSPALEAGGSGKEGNSGDQASQQQTQTTASSGTPNLETPPAKEGPSSSGSSVASQLVKDTTTVNNLKSVSVSGMNTTLSGVTTISQQTSTISNLLSENVQNLSSVIPNAQGLSSAFSALESAQNTLKGYLDSSSATIGQLTNGSNAVVGALDKAISQVDTALADLVTTDTQKTQAVTLATTGSSASSTTTGTINFLNALKTNLMAQKDAFMNVHKNIQTAVAQAQATYKPSVMNTNNYGQMYGVDAMAGYKWFFGKTKRFGFRTYGYYSYNHANLSFVGSKLGIMEGASQVNNFTYGVGFDALYNFYESKEGYNTAGLFLGFGLGGGFVHRSRRELLEISNANLQQHRRLFSEHEHGLFPNACGIWL